MKSRSSDTKKKLFQTGILVYTVHVYVSVRECDNIRKSYRFQLNLVQTCKSECMTLSLKNQTNQTYPKVIIFFGWGVYLLMFFYNHLLKRFHQ